MKTARRVSSRAPRQVGVEEPGIGFMPVSAVMISCISAAGRANIIPIIAWSFACRYPPKISIGICSGSYTPSYYERASYRMIRETREFVINFPDASMRDQVTLTGKLTANDPAVDKFAAAGLTPGRSLVVKAPTIEECPISIECVVTAELDLGSHHLFVGEVVAYHEPGALVDHVNQEEVDTLIYELSAGGRRRQLSWCSLVHLDGPGGER